MLETYDFIVNYKTINDSQMTQVRVESKYWVSSSSAPQETREILPIIIFGLSLPISVGRGWMVNIDKVYMHILKELVTRLSLIKTRYRCIILYQYGLVLAPGISWIKNFSSNNLAIDLLKSNWHDPSMYTLSMMVNYMG